MKVYFKALYISHFVTVTISLMASGGVTRATARGAGQSHESRAVFR